LLLFLEEVSFRTSFHSDEEALISTSYTKTTKSLELVLPRGSDLPLVVSKPGYEQVETHVKPKEVNSFMDVRLYKLPKMTSRRIAINITPPESEITINGIYAGKGNLVLDLKPDEPLELNFTLEGYNENYLFLDGEKEWPSTIEIELKKTIEKVIRGAYQEIIGIAVDGEDLFVSDWSGIIWYIHIPSSWRQYNTRTDNYPNLLSEPVVTSNYVYFSGKKNLVVMNRISGATLTVTRLNDRENHLKGQKVVPMDYQILYPTKDSIRFLTGDGSKIREVFIPGGSLMTPALYKGKIYTAATDGIIYEISSKGEILRSLETEAENPTGQSIIFDKGRGYFVDSRGSVTAFSPENMIREWKSPVLEEKDNFIYDVMLTNERVYFYGGEKIYTLDRMTGKEKKPLEGSILTRPLLWGDYIYAMTGEESMTVFSSSSGMPIKTIALGYEITSPIYHFNSQIMAGAYDGNVLIMNQLDPSLLSKPIK
jgi:outer membrane protein assembly factor BamB